MLHGSFNISLECYACLPRFISPVLQFGIIVLAVAHLFYIYHFWTLDFCISLIVMMVTSPTRRKRTRPYDAGRLNFLDVDAKSGV